MSMSLPHVLRSLGFTSKGIVKAACVLECMFVVLFRMCLVTFILKWIFEVGFLLLLIVTVTVVDCYGFLWNCNPTYLEVSSLVLSRTYF